MEKSRILFEKAHFRPGVLKFGLKNPTFGRWAKPGKMGREKRIVGLREGVERNYGRRTTCKLNDESSLP